MVVGWKHARIKIKYNAKYERLCLIKYNDTKILYISKSAFLRWEAGLATKVKLFPYTGCKNCINLIILKYINTMKCTTVVLQYTARL